MASRGTEVGVEEARRIAIARAFLSDAELWVIDEPTAHLDPDAEAPIIAALRTATKGRTGIVAPHSAAVPRCADTAVPFAHLSPPTLYFV